MQTASVAQWLQHCSRKPKVESSILSKGSKIFLKFKVNKIIFKLVKTLHLNVRTASVAQWLEHWSSKPGVESSILSRGSHFFFVIQNL